MSELTRGDPVVFHFRVVSGKVLRARGGATAVFLPDKKRFGVAMCCDKDNFCRRWGKKIAMDRANEGEQSRDRTPRFDSVPSYDGPLEMDAVKASAQALVYYAASQVDNPLLLCASVFIEEAEKEALKRVGIIRKLEDVGDSKCE